MCSFHFHRYLAYVLVCYLSFGQALAFAFFFIIQTQYLTLRAEELINLTDSMSREYWFSHTMTHQLRGMGWRQNARYIRLLGQIHEHNRIIESIERIWKWQLFVVWSGTTTINNILLLMILEYRSQLNLIVQAFLWSMLITTTSVVAIILGQGAVINRMVSQPTALAT